MPSPRTPFAGPILAKEPSQERTHSVTGFFGQFLCAVHGRVASAAGGVAVWPIVISALGVCALKAVDRLRPRGGRVQRVQDKAGMRTRYWFDGPS